MTTDSAVADEIQLKDLLLDGQNPRFGKRAGSFADQSAILDYIVEDFGVDTLLPSLAYNGYFSAEPIIVKPDENGKYKVVEGNRRLAACLILAGDERAKAQAQRSEKWREKSLHKWGPETTIPVKIYADEKEIKSLLPYLGVRHIVASQSWDSYAKAKWIADVVASKQMTADQISEVTGDKNRTIERLLEGYGFVNQLVAAGLFDSKQSVRKGRGSNPDYPFSWIYTLLDNSGVRNWIGLRDRGLETTSPIPDNRLNEAAETLKFLYGDRNGGRNPSISDSREIGLLAAALSDPNKRSLLRSGKSAREIDHQSRPAQDQLADQLNRALEALTEANTLLASGKITRNEARPMQQRAEEVSTLAEALFHFIAIGRTGSNG